MKIVLLGSGNVALHLGRALASSGVSVLQVFNRSISGLQKMASITKAPTTTTLSEIRTDADVYLLAIADDAIGDVAQSLSTRLDERVTIAHTSGSISMDEIGIFFKNRGAFYPLQSLNKERPIDFKTVPLFITTSSPHAEQVLLSLGERLSNRVSKIDDEARARLHVPAVVVNNFVNHLYAHVYDYCQKENLQISDLQPLMQETLDRINDEVHPAEVQTGPAIRKDQKTIKLHRSHLATYPALYKMYNYLTRSIQTYHENRK